MSIGILHVGSVTKGGSKYSISPSAIKLDLLNERPQWILSSYGLGKDAPIQLFGGLPREQSFEEMRLRHYQLAAQGKQQEAIQEARNLFDNAESQIRTALLDIEGAIKYVLEGENQHPNRIDICKARGLNSQANTGQSKMSALGQPSGFSASSQAPNPFTSTPQSNTGGRNPFAQSSFSQSSTTNQTGSAFGQPSFQASKPPIQSGFGQPSAPGQAAQGFQSNSAQSQAATPQPSSNPFATPAPSSLVNPFARSTTSDSKVSQPSLGASANSQASSAAHIRKDEQGRLQSWNGRPVSYEDDKCFYRDQAGQLRRVWFPEGPPNFASLESLPEAAYNEDIQHEYAILDKEGHFRNGIVPMIAPKKEWCNWNI